MTRNLFYLINKIIITDTQHVHPHTMFYKTISVNVIYELYEFISF